MSETTRKYYITRGGEFEKEKEYEQALDCYKKAYEIKDCSPEDNPDFFEAGYIEDKIAFLSYRLGEFRAALTFGAKAYRANPQDQRLKNNIPFYTDAIISVNPKSRLDNYITDFLVSNYPENYSVLDVGPLDGRWWYSLHNHFKKIDAVEAFEPYIEKYALKEKYENVFISDICTFEFDYYDIIILGDVLEHIPVNKAQELVKKLCDKCKQLLIIIPFEYPQDEIDDNKYQIHHQEDLTDEIFLNRYEGLELLIKDELRGAYIKKGTMPNGIKSIIYEALNEKPKTLYVGLEYFNYKMYSKAAGIFDNSLEIMTDENKALMCYYNGLSQKNLGNTLEALKGFTKAVEMIPSYKDALYECFKIFEKLELWSDLELYLRIALDHCNDKNNIDSNSIPNWKNLVLIQLTLALSKQKKNFEAYGFAALALESEASPERKQIAEHNFNELKRELWGTLQIDE